MAIPRKRQSPAPAPVHVIRRADAAEQTAPIVAQDPQQDPATLEAPEAPEGLDPALIASLEAETWEDTSTADSGRSGRSGRSGDDLPPPVWDAVTTAAAQKIGFVLPSQYPQPKRRKLPDGTERILPWRLVGMPKDPDALAAPVGSMAKEANRKTVKILDDIAHGWKGRIPSLAKGQKLPLAYVFALFGSSDVFPYYQANKSWQCLRNKDQAQITLLYALADRLGRYVYVESGMICTADSVPDSAD
jgi:hypothetical protein